jgi:serine/threonine protein kinase
MHPQIFANCTYGHTGSWKEALKIPEISLESKEKRLDGDEKTEFLRFMRRMLQWDPAQRPTAKELIYDDFLVKQYMS